MLEELGSGGNLYLHLDQALCPRGDFPVFSWLTKCLFCNNKYLSSSTNIYVKTTTTTKTDVWHTSVILVFRRQSKEDPCSLRTSWSAQEGSGQPWLHYETGTLPQNNSINNIPLTKENLSRFLVHAGLFVSRHQEESQRL